MRKFFLGAILALAVSGAVGGIAHRIAQANLAAGPMSIVFGCTQATNVIGRTSGENTSALQTLFCGLVNDGLITGTMAAGGPNCGLFSGGTTEGFDRFYLLGMANRTDALLDLCGNASAVDHPGTGSPAFAANSGFTGIDASSTVYLDTGFNPSTAAGHWLANSAHMMAWSFTNFQATSGGGVIMGQGDTTNLVVSQIVPWYSDGNSYCLINQQASTNPAVGASTGAWICDRNSAASSTFYRNGGVIGNNNNANATSLVNSNIYILVRDKQGTGAQSGGGYQVGAITLGGHMTAAQISSTGGLTGTGLVPRLCAYLTTVRGSC